MKAKSNEYCRTNTSRAALLVTGRSLDIKEHLVLKQH